MRHSYVDPPGFTLHLRSLALCETDCGNGVCDLTLGRCRCRAGWKGDNCDERELIFRSISLNDSGPAVAPGLCVNGEVEWREGYEFPFCNCEPNWYVTENVSQIILNLSTNSLADLQILGTENTATKNR